MIREADAWLFPLLREVRQRPGAWLGSERVRCLENYLAGYMKARRAFKVPELCPPEEARWREFDAWCAKEKIGAVDSAGWCGVVEMLDRGEHNVLTFFLLLEEFLAVRGERLDDFAPLE